MSSLQKSQRTFWQDITTFPTTVTMSLTLLTLGLLGSSSVSIVAASSSRIQHANSYAIRNVADDNCLTATRHTFRADNGVFVGEVLTSQCTSLTYQYWDAIRWKDTPANQFWLYPKSASLNELTTVPDAELARGSASGGAAGQAGQTQNLVEIRYVPNAKGAFLIRSTILGKCVQANGAELRISYETCDFAVREQQWTAEPLVQVDTNSFKC